MSLNTNNMTKILKAETIKINRARKIANALAFSVLTIFASGAIAEALPAHEPQSITNHQSTAQQKANFEDISIKADFPNVQNEVLPLLKELAQTNKGQELLKFIKDSKISISFTSGLAEETGLIAVATMMEKGSSKIEVDSSLKDYSSLSDLGKGLALLTIAHEVQHLLDEHLLKTNAGVNVTDLNASAYQNFSAVTEGKSFSTELIIALEHSNPQTWRAFTIMNPDLSKSIEKNLGNVIKFGSGNIEQHYNTLRNIAFENYSSQKVLEGKSRADVYRFENLKYSLTGEIGQVSLNTEDMLNALNVSINSSSDFAKKSIYFSKKELHTHIEDLAAHGFNGMSMEQMLSKLKEVRYETLEDTKYKNISHLKNSIIDR